jgi:hypothetical protein
MVVLTDSRAWNDLVRILSIALSLRQRRLRAARLNTGN